MINGFEEETKPLTDDERAIVPLFVRGLVARIGEDKAVTSEKMIAGLKLMGHDVPPARVRKIIRHIRMNKLVRNLIASSKGYYIENDTEKLSEYVYSLKQRGESIIELANSYFK